MDFPDAEKPTNAAQWRRAACVASILALLAYLEILGLYSGAVAAGSDSSGYFNHAKLLAFGSVHTQVRTLPGLPQDERSPFLYIPLGFTPAKDGNGMVATYPLGLSLFIVALKALIGWRHAGDAVILFHAAAGIAATYALARVLGLSRPWSVLCSAVIALSPLYMFMSLQAMSDVPSLAWTTLAVVAALRGREGTRWVLAAGFALSVDVLLRPANLLAAVPVLIALGWSPRRWAILIVAGIPGALVFFANNAASYGSFFSTGYGDNSGAFSSAHVPGTLLHYAHWIPILFTPLAFLALGLPFLPSGKYRPAVLLTSWVVVFAAFYCVYQNTHEAWWYLRFLLPAAPALAVGAALVLRMLLARTGRGREISSSPVAFAVALALVASSSIWWARSLGAMRAGEEQLHYGFLADWMRANLPPDAVCLAMQTSGSVYFYTPFTILRWDQIKKADVPRVMAAVAGAKRPLYAVLFPYEVTQIEDLQKTMRGKWIPVGKVNEVVVFQHLSSPP
jgi:hypothetical protein